MRVDFGGAKGRQGAGRHGRTEIRPTNADINDVGETLAQSAANPAVAHRAGESGDFFALRHHRRHDVLAIDQHRLAGKIAQGHVQGRAVFSSVDFFADEQGVSPLLEFCRARKVE